MKYIHFIFLILSIGCSSTYKNISLPVYFGSDDSGLGWGIKLNQDSTFNYGDGLAGCLGGSYSTGNWYQNGDTVVLNSFPIPNIIYIEETKEVYNGKLKIYVFGADTNSFDVGHIYYVKNKSRHPFVRQFDSEMLAKSGFNLMIDVFWVSKSKLLPTQQQIVISVDEVDLSFTIQDSTNNIIKIYLDDVRDKYSFDRKLYLNNHKLLLDGDKLFWGYNNGEYFDEKYPAIKKEKY
jgi:hypothetical protein